MRAVSWVVVAALAWMGGAGTAAPSAVAAGAGGAGASGAAATVDAAAETDYAVIGDRVAPSAQAGGYKRFTAGPVAGSPTTLVDSAARTVTVTVADQTLDSTGTMTMAWPARIGSWSLGISQTEPEQLVKLTRDGKECTFTAGTLTVHRAEATSTGQVAALTADVTGSCQVYGGGYYASAQVRIGDPDPNRVLATPRAEPARFSSGALAGTVVTHEITLSNSGTKPWTVGAAGTASTNSWSPRFTVVPEANACTGRTLRTGETCTLAVSATAPTWWVNEHLLVGGDAEQTLVVPISLEGYAPVLPPTAVTAAPGRLSATVSWQPSGTSTVTGYRVYDVTGGGRTLLTTTAPSVTSVLVPGTGPRTLAVVAINGRYAESPDVTVDVPSVASEVVGNDWYGDAVAVQTTDAGTSPASPLPPRKLGLERVDLDPSRTRWVTAARGDVSVCPVATEQCVTVPGIAGTGDADTTREAVWLPDGRIAFLRGWSEELRSLWVVDVDGSGLRKVANLPRRAQLAATAGNGEVVVHSMEGFGRLERVALADGRITPVPGTEWIDDFTVTTQGLLVVESRDDKSVTHGPRTTTLMNLDGSGARRLALPVGDNRQATFNHTGTRVAFARYTSDWEATLWTAAADGSGAEQLSSSTLGWIDLKWSVGDRLAPTTSVTVGSHTSRNATLAIGAADGDDFVGSLRRQCRVDAGAWTACGPTVALTGLAAGTHTVSAQVTDASGKQSAVVTKSWVVDAAAPTATLNAPALVQTATPMTLSWVAADSGGSGLANYDVRTRTAAPSSGFGAYQYPTSWQKLTVRTLPLTLSKGYQYCFSVRARDRAGNLGGWSAERCTSMPLDDGNLSASTGWTRGKHTNYLFSTYSTTVRSGAQLTRTGVSARRLALVATTCPTCGTVDVYHAGVKVGRVSLYSSTTKVRQVIWLPLQTRTRYGTVAVRSVSTKRIYVDGLGIVH
ncbi:hypothetical protein LL946_08040 [Knoellia locipacati]|uniref:hypothetical protein n=1 Tax=Knoellia locipacati TaxID=882824 RepID=UPI00384C7E04